MQFRWLLQIKICLFFNADKCRQHCGYVYVSVKVYSIPHFIITATILFFFQLQIFFLSRNRSVEKSLGSCRCCAAVYWKSGQDRSCSAGVGSLSPNENQMLMNQAIVAGSASEALALKPPLTHRRTLPPPPRRPLCPPFHSHFIPSSSNLTIAHPTHCLLCQVPVQVSQLQKQAQRPHAGGHLLARPALQDRRCL